MRTLFALLCLMISSAAWSATSQALTFPSASYKPWGAPYATPTATRDGPLVVLSGVVRVTGPGHIATAPVGMRPAQDIILRQTKGTYSIRVDIQKDGRIFAAGSVGNWVSLDGFAYTTQLSEHLSLASGASNYGDRFGSPRARKHGDLAVLSGLVRRASHGQLLTLPANLRPKEHLIFATQADQGTARIEIYPDGGVYWTQGGKNWVSLAGLNIPTKVGTMLPVGPGYAQYKQYIGGDYGEARALATGGFTVLSGLVIGLHPGTVVTLGADRRTSTARLMQGFAGAGTAAQNADVRLDMGPNGALKHSEGGPNNGWLSLSGLVIANPPSIPAAGTTERVALRSYHHKYVVAEADGAANANRAAIGGWETWTLEHLGGGVAALRSYHGTYLTAESNGTARAAAPSLTPNARWRLAFGSGGTIGLLGSTGKWLVAEPSGALNANRPAMNEWEHFTKQISPWQPSGGGGGGAGGGVQQPAPAGTAQTARNAVGNAAEVHNALDGLLDAALDKRTEDGVTWYQATRTVLGRQFTLILYWPSGAQQPNVALLPADAQFDLFKLLTDSVGMSELGAIKVAHAVFMWAPQANAKSDVAVASFPTPIRQRIQQVDPRAAIPVVGGQNVFGRLSLGDGTLRRALTDGQVGFCNGDCPVQVHAGYGVLPGDRCTAASAKGWFIRLSRPTWTNVFGMQDVSMTQPTVEVHKLRRKTLRAWAAQTTIKNTPYFLYAQCTLSACKGQNAFAFNAASVSLQDYKRLIEVLGARVLGGLPNDWTAGLDQIPLEKVRIESLDHPYDPAANLDANQRPRLSKMLGVFAGPQQQISGSDRCVTGEEVLARGRGVVLDRSVATLTADYWKAGKKNPKGRKRSGLYADGTLSLDGWSEHIKGNGVFSVRKDDNQAKMGITGKVKIATVIDEYVEILIGKSAIDFTLRASCPLRPFDVRFTGKLTGGLGVTWSGAATDCYGPLGVLIDAFINTSAKAISVAADAAEITQEVLYGLGSQFEAVIGTFGVDPSTLDLGGFQHKLHESLRREPFNYTVVHAGQAFGEAADRAGQAFDEIKDKFPDGAVSGAFTAAQTGGGKLKKFLSSLLSGQVSATGERAVTCNPPRIQIAGYNQTNVAMSAGATGHRATTSGSVSLTGRSAGCDEIAVAPGANGSWWRLDLGDRYEIRRVIIRNAGGSAGDKNHGLDNALVMLTNQDTLQAALADPNVVWEAGGPHYVRRYRLGKGAFHSIDTQGTCLAYSLPMEGPKPADAHEANGVRFRSVSSSRYIWIYQPQQIPLRISSVVAFGTPEPDQAHNFGGSPCDCFTCPPGNGSCGGGACWDDGSQWN